MKNVILVVLDGFGIAPPSAGNAITQAKPTHITSLVYSYPNTLLKASGEAVGLPSSEVGNTEVGHINLGAGRIVYQDLPRINMSVADGTFYKNQTFLDGLVHLKKTGGKLHLMGLVGAGSVHSSIDHLYALLHFAKENQLTKVFVHAITDGRDSPPKSASEIMGRVEEKLMQLQIGKIASVMGRYWAMDRDRRWERIEKAYRCLTQGTGEKAATAVGAISAAYTKNQTDEFIEPTNIAVNNAPVALIEGGDAVIFFNYRIDRPRELTNAFVLDNFEEDANKLLTFDPYNVKYHMTHTPHESSFSKPFVRGPKLKDLFFIAMTQYERGLPYEVAFPPAVVRVPLGRVLSEQGIYQLRMSESEKERFVTYYFNGLRDEPFPHEDRVIIPSPKVPTYDQKPEMSSAELTNSLIQKMSEQKYRFILVNYPNADMVGHTGNLEASVKAVQALDTCLEKLVAAAQTHNYTLLITADHGNVEEKINLHTGGPSTEHTANPVPFIIIDKDYYGKGSRLQSGILADVAPTILGLMGLHRPSDMTGRDILAELSF